MSIAHTALPYRRAGKRKIVDVADDELTLMKMKPPRNSLPVKERTM